MQKVEIRNWEGSSPKDLLEFLRRRAQVSLNAGRIVGGAYILECDPQRVGILRNLHGARFGGKTLAIKVLDGDSSSQTNDIMNVLRGFLQSRYDPQAKLLNLINVRSDPTLIQKAFFTTDTSHIKVIQAILKVAEGAFEPVASVSLEQNNLVGVSELTGLSVAFPKLLNLSLANNLIATANALNPWKKRFMHLQELVLFGNPISNSQAEMKKVIEFFPRLTRLNGIVVRSEQDLPKLAMPIQQNFFENPDIQAMAQGFILQFFKFWDSERSQLLPLYDNLSEFSYSLDTAAAHSRNHTRSTNGPTPRWTGMSRNLVRATPNNMNRFLTEKIALGKEAISDFFKRIPKTKTKLEDTEEFSFEAYQVQNIRQTPDTAILIATHGIFSEVGPRAQKFSFDRYLVVLPAPSGNMLIASDMMILRNPGNHEIYKSNQPTFEPAAPTPAANGSAGVATNGAPGTPATPGAPGAPGTPAAGAPEALVQQLMQQTGLNIQYATQCLQQANLDLQQALQLFQQHRGQLPHEAFI